MGGKFVAPEARGSAVGLSASLLPMDGASAKKKNACRTVVVDAIAQWHSQKKRQRNCASRSHMRTT